MLGSSIFRGVNDCTLNKEQTSFGELQQAKKLVVAIAYCTSQWCAGCLSKVEKEMTRISDRCPDCNHFLVYKQVKRKKVA